MNNAISKPAIFSSRDPLNKQLDGVPRVTIHNKSLISTWLLLRYTFGLVPIVAGLDKFTNLLVNWESYLNPLLVNMIPFDSHIFMGIVGVIEIIAGILVLTRPRLGGFVVAAWLIGIAFSLIASGNYLDVAVRDLVMGIGAFSLANLTSIVEPMRDAELHQ